MDMKEKLVELLKKAKEKEQYDFLFGDIDTAIDVPHGAEYYADYLIAHGVTVQECGHWIEKPSGAYGRWQSWCSSCGKHSGIGGIESNRHKPYCPNCGAKMMPQPPKGE